MIIIIVNVGSISFIIENLQFVVVVFQMISEEVGDVFLV